MTQEQAKKKLSKQEPRPPKSREPVLEREPPLSRAQLERLYLEQRLSLQQIAEQASALLGISVSRPKVREWLLWHRLPRRSFAEAARVKFQKNKTEKMEKKAANALGTDALHLRQPSLFEELTPHS